MTQTNDTTTGKAENNGQHTGPGWAEGGEEDENFIESEAEKDALERLIRHRGQQKFLERQAGPPQPFNSGLLSEFQARPQQPLFRVHGLVIADSGTLVVAQRKTGKTTLMLNLAHSLDTGKPFLGAFNTIPVEGRIGFLNYELPDQQFTQWATDIGIDPDRLYIQGLLGRPNPLRTERDRERLASEMRELSVESVFIDPIASAYTGASHNDPGEFRAWLDELLIWTQTDVGARDLIISAHAGWQGEHARGASSQEDWGRSIITMTKDEEGQRFLRALGSDVEVDEDRLDYDKQTRLLRMSGAGGRTQAKKAAKAEEAQQNLRDRLLAYVGDHPRESFNGISKNVSGRQQTKREIIAEAVADGVVVVEPDPDGTHRHILNNRRSDPYPEYPGPTVSQETGYTPSADD